MQKFLDKLESFHLPVKCQFGKLSNYPFQLALLPHFPGFSASGWLLKLQAELDKNAEVNARTIMKERRAMWKFMLRSEGYGEQLGRNTSSALISPCLPPPSILAQVLSTCFHSSRRIKVGLSSEEWRTFQQCIWPCYGS